MAVAGAVRRGYDLLARRELLLLCAVALLSRGTTVTFGVLSSEAIALVVAAAVFIALAQRAPDQPAGTAAWVCAVAACAVTTFTYARLLNAPVESDLAVALLVTTVIAVLGRQRSSQLATVLAAATVLAMMALVWRWGAVNIDVFRSLQNASAAVLHGANPYLTTFTSSTPVAPGHFVDLTMHYQYFPGVALIIAPARMLGDVRLMNAIAVAALIAFAVHLALQSGEESTRSRRALALCLALPITVPMIHFAWVDVYSVAGFAGWIALRRKHRGWATVCLALSLTIKPTILVALVPALIWSRPARKEILVAAIAAAVVALPYALLTGVSSFYQDVIGVQASLGFRFDGLTLGGAWFALTGHIPPVWFGAVAGAGLAFFALRTRPEDVCDVMIAGAFLSTAAFLLAKWAFLNYYFIPVWLLVLALAGRGVVFDSEADIALPALAQVALRHRPSPHPPGRPHGALT